MTIVRLAPVKMQMYKINSQDKNSSKTKVDEDQTLEACKEDY